jgi:biotin-(acetyl-CoA carboxylase) ligase
MSEVRRVQVALSIDALMQQWARQEDGPAGSALIATTEIAGRLRGGVEWRHENSISVGVLARPRALEPPAVDLGWLAASIGAASALDLVTGGRHGCQWPDRVVRPTFAVEGVGQFEVAISSVGQLGPGRIDHIIMIVRIVGLGNVSADLATAVVDEVRAAALLLDEPGQLLQRYRDVCSTLSRQVSMTLLPRGSVRGLARDVGQYGGLLLESPTGLIESVPVTALGRLEMIDD